MSQFHKKILKHLNIEQGDALKFNVDADGKVSIKKFTSIEQTGVKDQNLLFNALARLKHSVLGVED